MADPTNLESDARTKALKELQDEADRRADLEALAEWDYLLNQGKKPAQAPEAYAKVREQLHATGVWPNQQKIEMRDDTRRHLDDFKATLTPTQAAIFEANIASGIRTPEEQAQLWNKRFESDYPALPPGESQHEPTNGGMATDFTSAVPDSLLTRFQQFNERQKAAGQNYMHRPDEVNDPIHWEIVPGSSEDRYYPGGTVLPPLGPERLVRQ